MADDLIQNVVDILENARCQKIQLSELLTSIQESQDQVHQSASKSKKELEEHFCNIKTVVVEVLDSRLAALLQQVDSIEQAAIDPLDQCKDMISQGLESVSRVMLEGKDIFAGDPKTKLEQMIKLKDNSDTKALNSVPAVPSLSDVPCITVELSEGLDKRILELLDQEGKVLERAPVQIVETNERPGAIMVRWMEVDEELEVSDFCLQYCYGNVKTSNAPFQNTAYIGSATSYTVKNLKTDMPYSFRVSCRSNNNSSWNVWSVPVVACTSLPHYQWGDGSDAYTVSIENKMASRLESGVTHVLYSKIPCYTTGNAISFRVIGVGETSPLDCIGIALDKNDSDTLHREGAVLVSSAGAVFVDGQEMKIKLPELKKGSVLTFETEVIAKGKVRVHVELEEKVVTADLKAPELPNVLVTAMRPEDVTRKFFFGMRFSHQDWVIKVE